MDRSAIHVGHVPTTFQCYVSVVKIKEKNKFHARMNFRIESLGGFGYFESVSSNGGTFPDINMATGQGNERRLRNYWLNVQNNNQSVKRTR